MAAVERGDSDVVEIAGPFGATWSARRVAALAARSQGRLYTDASPETDFMFLNVKTPPFDDVRVRRALNYAVDRREVARDAGGADLAQLTCQLPPPGFPATRRHAPTRRAPIPAVAGARPTSTARGG